MNAMSMIICLYLVSLYVYTAAYVFAWHNCAHPVILFLSHLVFVSGADFLPAWFNFTQTHCTDVGQEDTIGLLYATVCSVLYSSPTAVLTWEVRQLRPDLWHWDVFLTATVELYVFILHSSVECHRSAFIASNIIWHFPPLFSFSPLSSSFSRWLVALVHPPSHRHTHIYPTQSLGACTVCRRRPCVIRRYTLKLVYSPDQAE